MTEPRLQANPKYVPQCVSGDFGVAVCIQTLYTNMVLGPGKLITFAIKDFQPPIGIVCSRNLQYE